MPRLLLITYEFPPKGGPGVLRPLKTAKYLSRMGWDVTVLTVKDPLGGMMDETLLDDLPESVRVERAWSLEPTRAVAAMRRLRDGARSKGRDAAESRSGSATGGTRGYTALPRGVIRLVQAFFVPDEKVGWTPWAVRAASGLHAEVPFDIVLASGPPFSAYGVAWRVARRIGVPWVADVRDPIVGGYFFRPPTPLHARLMSRYERTVARRAARLVTTTGGLAREILSRNPELQGRIDTITNGFDPEDFAAAGSRDRRGFVVAYTGTFQGSIRPDALLAAIAMLRENGSAVADDLRVRFVGSLDERTAEAIEAYGVAEYVERTGYVTHANAILEMLAADVLLLVLGPEPASAAILTGKLPEYLRAGRPVLALVPDGVAADVVRRSGAGEIIAPDDTPGVAEALDRLHTRWREDTLPAPAPEVVAQFDRVRLTRRYAEVLERAMAHESET